MGALKNSLADRSGAASGLMHRSKSAHSVTSQYDEFHFFDIKQFAVSGKTVQKIEC
jgi:hypothetical protein